MSGVGGWRLFIRLHVSIDHIMVIVRIRGCYFHYIAYIFIFNACKSQIMTLLHTKPAFKWKSVGGGIVYKFILCLSISLGIFELKYSHILLNKQVIVEDTFMPTQQDYDGNGIPTVAA